MGFNFGDWMNNNIFKTNELKQITGGIGSIFGKGLSFKNVIVHPIPKIKSHI